MVAVIVIIVFIAAVIGLAIIFQPSPAQKKQQQVTNAAQKAANTYVSNANANSNANPAVTVTNVKTSGRFAIGTTTINGNPAQGIFTINSDGTLTQIASGTSFSPIELLGYGMSLTDIATLTGRTIAQAQQWLFTVCNYTGGSAPGYSGFTNTFANGQVTLDPQAITTIQNALTGAIAAQNATESQSQQMVCINAVTGGSTQVANPNVNVVTTFNVQFIAGDGTLTTHSISLTVDMNFNTTVTLDGTRI